MRIGEVAANCGVNIQTVRLYERIGLLKEPRRRPSGYRDYSIDAIDIIRFIKRTKELGFTLKEIKALLRLRERGHFTSARMREVAQSKLADIDERIRNLQIIREALAHGLESCDCKGDQTRCLLFGLNNHEE
jgi:MerR family copper efflux transcriptional regulator